jgi:hypothetical protein
MSSDKMDQVIGGMLESNLSYNRRGVLKGKSRDWLAFFLYPVCPGYCIVHFLYQDALHTLWV